MMDLRLMPRKTLALISGLVLVTIVLFIIALRAGQQQQAPSAPQTTPMAQQPTPINPAHTVLALAPNPLTVAPGQQGKVDVTIDTSDNDVTAVQLELGYDPTLISNVKVTPGSLFQTPAVLINKDDPKAGRYTYAFGITPNSQTVKGQGIVATVTFTTSAAANGKSTQIGLLPTTLVTARGVANSVMKSAGGTVVTIGTATGTSTGANDSSNAAPYTNTPGTEQ